MKTMKAYNLIAALLVGLFTLPFSAMAYTSGMPEFAVDGVSSLNRASATVTVSFDSRNAEYGPDEQPRIYVEFINTRTNETRVSPYIDQWHGARSDDYYLENLEPGTTYSYRAVMRWDGSRYNTNYRTFKTVSSNLSYSGTETATVQNSEKQVTVKTKTESITPNVSPVTTKAKSAIYTSETVQKNGVALGISDAQARVRYGDSFTYTVTYHNMRKTSLQNAELTIELPEQYEFVRSSADLDYDESNNTITHTIGRISAGTSKSFTFTARAIGSGNGEIKTIATLYFEGGSITATDRDAYTGRESKSALGASVFGAGFFPQTLGGWILVSLLILAIIIITRRYTTVPAPKKPDQVVVQKTA